MASEAEFRFGLDQRVPRGRRVGMGRAGVAPCNPRHHLAGLVNPVAARAPDVVCRMLAGRPLARVFRLVAREARLAGVARVQLRKAADVLGIATFNVGAARAMARFARDELVRLVVFREPAMSRSRVLRRDIGVTGGADLLADGLSALRLRVRLRWGRRVQRWRRVRPDARAGCDRR